MAGPASDYHRGDMDISEQTATFHLVMGMTKWGSLVMAAALALLVFWFCTPAGFGAGVVTAVIVLVLGFLALRERKTTAAH
jgi:hypothetical protein